MLFPMSVEGHYASERMIQQVLILPDGLIVFISPLSFLPYPDLKRAEQGAMKHSPLIIILATVFIALVGFGIVIPLLPVYAEQYGASGFTVGMLMMSYSLMQFIFAPIAGRLSDRFGRRPVMLGALLLTTASYILFGFADNLVLLFVSRIMAGLGGADITVAQAYVADVTPLDKRSKGMGLFGAAFGVGFTLGPAIAGILAPIDQRLPAFAAAGFTGITFLFALVMLKEPRSHAERQASRSLLKIKLPKPVLTATMLNFFHVLSQSILHGMFVLFTVHTRGWDVQENGLFLGMVGIVSATFQGILIGPLTKRFGQTLVVKAGLVFLGSGLLIIGLQDSLPLLIVGGIVDAMGFALATPTLASLASIAAPSAHQGRMLGIFQSVASLARILGPVLGGVLFDLLGPESPFLTGGVIALLTFLAAIATLRQRHYTSDKEPYPSRIPPS